MTAVGDDERELRLAAVLPSVDRYLQEEAARRHYPSLAVGIVVGDRLVYARGFGRRMDASLEPVTVDTIFRIGSITKVFTGLSLLRLRDEGRLHLDDPVTTFLPELTTMVYPTRDSPVVTIRNLVTHTSGIPRLGLLRYSDGHEVTEQELLRAGSVATLEFSPGTKAVYSNLAMALAGVVVGRASGQRYRDYVTEHVLRPLGMTATVWDRSQVPANALAQGHAREANTFRDAGPHWRMGAAEGMGGLYSNIRDMARFAAFELSAWPARDEPETGPLRRSSLRESQLPAGFGLGSKTFGINWVVIDDRRLGHVVFHNGGTEGFSSSMWLLPERRMAVIALLGVGDPSLDAVAKHVALDLVGADKAGAFALPISTALERVKALIAMPDEKGIEAAFSPRFLAAIPAAQLVALFKELHGALGVCRGERLVESAKQNAATVRFRCDNGTAELQLETSPDPPYAIEGFAMHPTDED